MNCIIQGGVFGGGPQGSVLVNNLLNILINNWDDDSGGIIQWHAARARKNMWGNRNKIGGISMGQY